MKLKHTRGHKVAPSSAQDPKAQAHTSSTGIPPRIIRILVPTDFSKPSIRALHTAVDFARQYGGRITLLSVLEPPSLPKLSTYPQVTKLGIWLSELSSQLDDLGRKHIDPEHFQCALAEYGKPFEKIVEVARVHKTDLIIIATHGRTGLKRLLLGSTAERVIRYAPCPVLTVQLEQKSGWPMRAKRR